MSWKEEAQRLAKTRGLRVLEFDEEVPVVDIQVDDVSFELDVVVDDVTPEVQVLP